VGEPWAIRDVVKRLRRKLGDDAHRPAYLFTVRRVGYHLAAPQPPPPESAVGAPDGGE
jgi:DNA-binding response OmpR family regulator